MMLIFLYLFGFLTGAAIAFVLWLFDRMRSKKGSHDAWERGFHEVLRY